MASKNSIEVKVQTISAESAGSRSRDEIIVLLIHGRIARIPVFYESDLRVERHREKNLNNDRLSCLLDFKSLSRTRLQRRLRAQSGKARRIAFEFNISFGIAENEK